MSGAGFFLRHDVARQHLEARGAIDARHVLEHGAHGRLRGRRRDRERPPASSAAAMTRATPGRAGSRPAATISV